MMLVLEALLAGQILLGLDNQLQALDSIPSGRTVLLNTRHETLPNCDEAEPFMVKRLEVRKTLVGWQDRMVGRFAIDSVPVDELVFQRLQGDLVYLTASLDGGSRFQPWCLPSGEVEGIYVQTEDLFTMKIPGERLRHSRSSALDKATYSAMAIAGGTALGLLGGALYGTVDGSATRDLGRNGYLMAGAGVGMAAGLFVSFQICFSGW